MVVTTRQMASQRGRRRIGSGLSHTRNVEAVIQRTPPHLLNQQNRKHLNMKGSVSTSHPVSSINHTGTSNEDRDNLGSRPISLGGSSSSPQDHCIYTGIAAQEGQTKGFLYLPALLSTTPQSSATSRSVNVSGTPMTSHNTYEHLRSVLGGSELGGSNSRKEDYKLPLHLSSFYPIVPHTNGNNNWSYFQHQRLAQHHQCNQPGRQEQLPLPSSLSSHNTSRNISNTASTRAISSSVLGKRPALTVSNTPSQSFFHPPPPLDTDDHTVLARGPQCRLETDELLSLVQSLGTPEFLSNSEKLFGSGSSLYEHPHPDASSFAPAGGGSTAVSPLSLVLGSGNGGGGDKGKGKEVSSYWDLSAMAATMESMKKQRLETSQTSPDLTLGLNGQGSSKNTMQRRPWN
ncbi:hypothetical protein ACP70R_030566 [Stipagrostis hirtigluma subsp. patula]